MPVASVGLVGPVEPVEPAASVYAVSDEALSVAGQDGPHGTICTLEAHSEQFVQGCSSLEKALALVDGGYEVANGPENVDEV